MRFSLRGNQSFERKKRTDYSESKPAPQWSRFISCLLVLIVASCFAAPIASADFSVTGGTVTSGVIQARPATNQSNSPTVTITGTRFTNKLLVLMDGRTIYTPLYSGVFWDTQDTILEDIEQIEVRVVRHAIPGRAAQPRFPERVARPGRRGGR